MEALRPIHIIGGGLAGLALGIALRRRNVPVVVSEAGHYPRHRVCGEFISGRGIQVLRRLDLEPLLAGMGALRAEDAAFFVGHRVLGVRRLPSPALCLSRYVLDATLAERLRALGGVIENGRVAATPAEGVVLATGRRPESADARGWKWFGLKAHARNVELSAALEMHLDENAYIGLCRVGRETVNVCGLFRRKRGDDSPARFDTLRGRPGTALFARMQRAEFEPDSFCAVAGLCLHPQPIEPACCRIGDAWTMIPPITGNGMSMAFESAELAVEPLAAYAHGERDWPTATGEVNAALTEAFASRLRWAARLHALLFHGFAREWLLPALYGSAWGKAFAMTRH